MQQILAWAETPSRIPTARLVTGEGGAGKTRLAATAANLLRERGWTAGFVKPAAPVEFTVARGRGLLLILDYPEENLAFTRALLQKLAEHKTAPYPVRLVLLSRRDFGHWESEALILEGRFGRQAIATPKGLSVEDAADMIVEAAENFARHAKLPLPALNGLRAWLEATDKHRMPLFAAAAAIHAVLAPEEAFGIGGAAIVCDLADRERLRVRKVSRGLGLGEATLGRLLALGILADGLDQSVIEKLWVAGIGDGLPKHSILSALSNTPWWQDGRLMRLQPDRPAAAFLDRELFDSRVPQGDIRLSDWLAVTLSEAPIGFGTRLGRILFDLDEINPSRQGAHPLEGQLHRMLAEDPSRARAFASVISEDVPFAALGFAAEVAIRLRGMADDAKTVALYSYGAAVFLSRLERHAEALAAAEEAVNIRRALARTQPEAVTSDLAMALNILAICLSQLGRREPALAAITEAITIHRALEQGQSGAVTRNLAKGLHNLALMLSELGRPEEALAAAEEAVHRYRGLAKIRPDAFESALPMALNNLALRLSELGRREEALAVAEEAVDCGRALAQIRPEALTPDLAMVLKNFAIRLSELERFEEALAAAEEAVSIRRALVRARPAAFTLDLAFALQTLAATLFKLGRREEALAAAQEAAKLRADTQ